MADVLAFRSRPKKALTNRAALTALQERGTVEGVDGWIEFSSYAALADSLKWEKTRAWKAVQKWAKDKRAEMKFDEITGRLSLRILPDLKRLERGKGTGVDKPKRGKAPPRRRGKSTAKPMENSTASTVESAPEPAVEVIRQTRAKSTTSVVNENPTEAPKGASAEDASERENTSAAGIEITSTPTPEIPPPPTSPDTANPSISRGARMGFFTRKAAAKPAALVAGDAMTSLSPGEGRLPRYESQSIEPQRVYARPVGRERAGEGVALDGTAALLWLAALILTCFSVILAVRGFEVLLPGWALFAAGLATALEFTRLLAIGYFTSNWRSLGAIVAPLMAAVILLGEGVSLVGAYSELQNLHQGDRPATVAAAATSTASANAQVEYQRSVIADLDRQIQSLDHNTDRLVEADTRRRGRQAARDARNQMGATERQLAPLREQRKQAAAALAKLQAEAAKAAGGAAVADAEAGPVRQLAALLSVPAEVASRYWLLAITILVGPAAGVLVAAASRRRRSA